MRKIEHFKKKYNDFMYDHIHLKRFMHEANGVMCGTISALLYAFGFACFISAFLEGDNFTIVTGGVSGLAQNVALFLQFTTKIKLNPGQIQAIGYTLLNIPLLIFAFFKIGKRFSIQTAINVILSSLFLWLFNQYGQDIIRSVVESPVMSYPTIDTARSSLIIVRALFAAICTGFSSAIAFKGDTSCGGIDIVTYYVSMRKSTSVGKYSIIFNSFIVGLYSVIIIVHSFTMGTFGSEFGTAILSLMVSSVYQFITSLIVDMIHLRNKKIQIEFITKNPALGQVLISNFPHGATMSQAAGVYSNESKIVIRMVVSSFETQKVVAVAKRADPHVFITVTSLVQVYGNFFIRPVN
ncbi:MAG: YitT family protein [Bacilli bacterium]|jgi:uncharacterized membrane-anchored protein YitT (DUF2179 family)